MYIDSEKLHSAAQITKHLKRNLKAAGYEVDLECIKTDRKIHTFWAHDDTLYKHSIDASVIYVVKESQLEEIEAAIIESIEC